LEGIVVADLTQNVAGPFCTQTLGDMGAEVVKIERPGRGDDARAWAPPYWGRESATFISLNRNKKSLALDLKSPGGLEVLHRLVGRADVFVQSLRPGAIDELGLDFAGASRINPRIVYCSVTAFGARGPLSHLPGYDPLMQAYSGLMSVNGHPDQEPARVGTSIVDMGTGMWAALGIVAALRQRDATGRAVEVTTALFETALMWMSYHAMGYFASGAVPQPQGSGTAMIAPYQAFPTADGFAMIGAASDALFARLAAALGCPEMVDDARFKDNPSRVTNRAALIEALSARTRERKAAGGGLTTPEFSILLSYTKIGLSEQLIASDLPEDRYLSAELERYFPKLLRERFPEQLRRHPLRREIIVSRVVNDLVNRAGTTFAFRLADETGAAAADVARAYTAAREVFDLPRLWAQIEALDGRVPAETQIAMLLRSRILLERSTRWLLRNRRRPLDVAATISRFAPGAAAISETVPTLLTPGVGDVEQLSAAGVPAALAEQVAHIEALVPALDIVEIAESVGLDAVSAARAYFDLGDRLELHWLRDQIVALPRDTRWDAMARSALRDDVYAEQAALTADVLRAGANGRPPAERVEAWLAHNEPAVDRCLNVVADLRAAGPLDLARLSVAVREVRNLMDAAAAPGPTEGPDLSSDQPAVARRA